MGHLHSSQTERLLEIQGRVLDFFTASDWALRRGEAGANDFVAGNPQEMALSSLVEVLKEHTIPKDKNWFAYKLNEPHARQAVAASLKERFGIAFEDQDIFLTPGAFGALAVTLKALIDPGDEVIFVSPPWFFYEGMISANGGTAVRVKVDMKTFDLDLDAIGAAITPRTRAIIVNSPNNPTGRIYPDATITALAGILTTASRENGRPLFLISDEAYSKILFDGNKFMTPSAFYENTILIYTFGKTLLAPGERLGYIALPPTMSDRRPIGLALTMAQLVNGFSSPNAILQHAIADLDKLSIDIGKLQLKRDRMVSALREIGYQLHTPEATFYLLPRSPLPDDGSFVKLLADRDVFVLPGAVVEMPGFFRISVTASEEMIERSLPAFAEALALAK